MSEALKSSQGAVWIQETPGKEPVYIGCIDVDALAESRGDQTLINCHDGRGGYVVVGSTGGPPEAVTTSLTALEFPESDVLDSLIDGNCMVNVYLMQRKCGRAEVFDNYVRGKIMHHTKLTNVGNENVVMREEDNAATRKLDLSAWNPVYRVRPVTVSRQTTASIVDWNDISFCNDAICAGECGVAGQAGSVGFAVGDVNAGVVSDVYTTTNAGTTWTVAAAMPFGAAQNAMSSVCFQIDRDSTRWLVARGTLAATALAVAYSDDAAATAWNSVTVGALVTEAAVGPQSLCAIDARHIWLATDGAGAAGNMYFSSDGGLSWTLQGASSVGGTSINCVHFSDFDNGYAGGAGDVIIKTTDGGTTWTAVAATGTGDAINTIWVFNQYRVIVGTATGHLFQSWDGGLTWTQGTFTGSAAGIVKCIEFAPGNDLVGYMAHTRAATHGDIHRTIDGGYSWERLDTITNVGINSVKVINPNLAHAVGEDVGATALALIVSG